jgi:hypothetical protein
MLLGGIQIYGALEMAGRIKRLSLGFGDLAEEYLSISGYVGVWKLIENSPGTIEAARRD